MGRPGKKEKVNGAGSSAVDRREAPVGAPVPYRTAASRGARTVPSMHPARCRCPVTRSHGNLQTAGSTEVKIGGLISFLLLKKIIRAILCYSRLCTPCARGAGEPSPFFLRHWALNFGLHAHQASAPPGGTTAALSPCFGDHIVGDRWQQGVTVGGGQEPNTQNNRRLLSVGTVSAETN